jgi:hypothetical protein
MFPVIAVVAALGGAIAFAVSSVIEQHVTHEVTERRALDPRLLLDLVREPAWVGSIWPEHSRARAADHGTALRPARVGTADSRL